MQWLNKAVIDCRLRRRCCHLWNYFKRASFSCQWLYTHRHYVQEVVHNHDVIWGAMPPGASVEPPPVPSDDRVRAPVIVRPAGKRYVTSIAASCCFSENNRPSLSPEQQQYRVTWRALRPCDGVTIHPLPLLLSRRRLVPRRRERWCQCIVYCSLLSVSWRGVVSNVGQINV